MTRLTTTSSPQSSSSPRAISLKSPVIGWTRRISKFIKKASNGRTVRQFDTESCSGTGGCADTQTLPRHNRQLERVPSTLSHKLPFLTLALKNLEKRKADFSKNSQEVWEQLIRLMRDIRQWDNKPSLIDLSVATKVVELITKLVSFRQSQPITGDTTRPEQDTRALTKIALSCARKVLTFLIGEILSLHEILPRVPRKEGSLFLDFTLNEDITSIAEVGEYYLLDHEVGMLSDFVLDTSVNFYTNLLTNIQTLNKLLLLIHQLGQLQTCDPYPLKSINPELIRLVNTLEQLPKKDWRTDKLTNQEVQIQFRNTIRESRKIFWLTIPLPREIIQEEIVWQATGASAQNNLSIYSQESTNLASLLRQFRGLNIIENQLVQPKESNNLVNTSTQTFRRRRSRRNRRSLRGGQSQREDQEEDFSVAEKYTWEVGPITQQDIDAEEIRQSRQRFYSRLGLTLKIVRIPE